MRNAIVPILLLAAVVSFANAGDWPQWGGPTRDFASPNAKIIDKWPDAGPKTLWKRDLGAGYSSIVAANGTLYTMYRTGDDENVIALEADTGKTKWTHTYAAPIPSDAETGFGKGPNATPLIAGERVVTLSFDGRVHCLDRNTGKVLWTTHLVKDQGGRFVQFGFASSPLLHRDMVILPVGAKGKALAAFTLADDKIRWSSGGFENSYSSPIIVDVGGKKQITLVSTKDILGFDADTGEELWSHAYKNQWDCHCTTPVDCGDGRVFYPSFEGGILLKLAAGKDGTEVKELWTTRKIGTGQNTVVRAGDYLYGAGGSDRASFLCCARLDNGEVAWRERVPQCNTIVAGGKLILLDENGTLRIAPAAHEKYAPACEASILEAKAWTTPTLVDGRLYLRDQKSIMAADVSGN